jgi:DNA-directed RNA polymerase subunit beta'
MAYLDHEEAYEAFKECALAGIKANFPIQTPYRTVELTGLEVQERDLHADDIRSQLDAKLKGKTWASTIFGNIALKDTSTGKVLDTRKMRLAELPKVTKRQSFIVGGTEYQVKNQWQLKPGIYARRSAAGEIEAHFNVPNKREFDITFDPATKQFRMARGGSKAIPAYPLLKTLGVDDDSLERDWGKEILQANKNAKGSEGALAKFFKVDRRRPPKSQEEAEQYFKVTMDESRLRPEATLLTTGKPYTNVTGDALRVATTKLLKIQGGAPEDDRDSILFKDLRTVGDFAFERLTSRDVKKSIRKRITRKFFKANDLRDLIKYDMFNVPMERTFTKSDLSNHATQVNPVDMLAGAQQTTIMGEGGIQSQDAVDNMVNAKFINPSHMGYLDPVRTPESEKSGVELRLPMGLRQQGTDPVVTLYNLRNNKFELVPPAKFFQSTVVLPDQVEWKTGKPVPIAPKVKVSGPGNRLEEVKFNIADYAMKHPSQLFSLTTNLIPFLGNNSGNRATYATQHIEQAISLKDREAPRVQVATGVEAEGMRTFEEILGRHSSHASPVNGVVDKIKDDAIVVKGPKGNAEVQLYKNFPLNDPKAVMSSEPTVRVGDSVKRGQSIADSNFTKNGTLALGTNLRVAYVPYKGYNFEDGVVISRSAAGKLTSVHMHKPELRIEKNIVTDPRRFKIQHVDAYGKEQFAKLDGTGVVRIGEKVRPGDPLILAMRPYQIHDQLSLQQIGKALSGRQIDATLRWTSDYPGEVVNVHKSKDKIIVHVRTEEPMQIGDKITGRHGNKGIVTRIVDDEEMLRTKDGKPIEIALNPTGVVGRMNLGQVLETAAAKLAEKTNKPYIVDNFANVDQLAKVRAELKKNGIPDKEELIDPVTGISLGKALVGSQYMLKLKHQIDHKNAVRAGMSLPGGEEDPEMYDRNLLPAAGGNTGGQSVGSLDLYTLLAHGAKANIREMQTWKSEGPDVRHPDPAKQWPSQHDDVWEAMQLGHPLPTPRPTFSYRKFEDMLRAAGLNIEKRGHHLQLLPMTDKQILNMSSGEIQKPGEIIYPSIDKFGEPKPIKGGLFDPKVTGGHGGKRWSHIALAEPIPNPMFEKAIQRVTGLGQKEYLDIAQGTKALSKDGEVVALGTAGSLTGGPAIARMLKQIDVGKELDKSEKELSTMTLPSTTGYKATPPKIDKLVKKIKTLRALDATKLSADDAYILKNLPVIPPIMRAPSILPSGAVKSGDLNELYKYFGQVNTAMKDPELTPYLDEEGKKRLRTSLYDGVRALMGIGVPYADQKSKGILHQIAGEPAKSGYFQDTLMARRQDMSMRSTIVPEPALDLDEVGLPADKALTLYKPFVVKKLTEMGLARNVLEARDLLVNKDKSVYKALEEVIQDRPILLKRDPTLHRHSMLAFKPKLVAGKAIRIHPLVTSGYNADFDGDTMSAYVPIHAEAVEEAKRMMPSQNLFNEASGRVAFPTKLEMSLGLYKLSRITGATQKKFTNAVEAINAVNQGKLSLTDVANIGGIKTTAGRVLIASAVPEDMKEAILKDHKKLLNSKGIEAILDEAAHRHKNDFGDIANKLKDIGNGAASGAIPIFHDLKGPDAIRLAEANQKKYVTTPVHSFGLEDFEPDRASRDPILKRAKVQADIALNNTSIPKGDRERRVADIWLNASEKMVQEHLQRSVKDPTNLDLMLASGTKPGLDQYKQMILAPVLMEDAAGKPILSPIMKSYSEGLDLAGYWTQQQGARRGTVMKVQEVRDPGTFSKRMVQTSMNLLVTADDCGTTNGIAMNVGDNDVYDRVLAKDFVAKKTHFSAGTVLTPDVVSAIRAADKAGSVIVRSPLKCEHSAGVCKKCAGLKADGKEYELGTNVGIIASQSMGERSTQLTMKAFHSGGVRSTGGARAVSDFDRIEQLTYLPDHVPDAAVLAMKSGKIEKIEQDPTGVKIWINGVAHHVGKDKSGMPLHANLPGSAKMMGYKGWTPPKVGTVINAGAILSDPNRTVINPRDLYRATNNMEKVQNFLVDELHGIYGKDVRRQQIETAVKAMSNLTKIRDPGDADDLLIGEFQPASVIRARNRELIKAGKQPIEHSPVLKGIDQMPQAVQEDWMAKMMHTELRKTMLESAAIAARSNLHGIHPVPGAAYGAEFGLTSEHANKPGLAHLKDVPRYAY